MTLIASQTYIKVERKIENEEQQYLEQKLQLSLYPDKIISETEEFTLEEVLDISYRSLSERFGFLYLHTIRGVFTFQIYTTPEILINQFKLLKNKF